MNTSKVTGFTVSLYFTTPTLGELDDSIPPHNLIVRPIVEQATEGWLFRPPRKSYAMKQAKDIIVREGKRWRLSVDKEIIRGYEALWNSAAGDRGTVVLLSRIASEQLTELFSYCGKAWTWDTSSERAVFTAPALKYATDHATDQDRVFIFSLTNGIEWMGIYSHHEDNERLFAKAQAACKPFKRSFEVSEPSRFNIIGEYHKRGMK